MEVCFIRRNLKESVLKMSDRSPPTRAGVYFTNIKSDHYALVVFGISIGENDNEDHFTI